jgi:hypothetical protein
MNKNVYEEGFEKGRRVGQVELVCSMLEEEFGPVSAAIRTHLEQLSIDELRRLAFWVGTAATLAELGLPTPGPAE